MKVEYSNRAFVDLRKLSASSQATFGHRVTLRRNNRAQSSDGSPVVNIAIIEMALAAFRWPGADLVEMSGRAAKPRMRGSCRK
jgi:hypothetical protein